MTTRNEKKEKGTKELYKEDIYKLIYRRKTKCVNEIIPLRRSV